MATATKRLTLKSLSPAQTREYADMLAHEILATRLPRKPVVVAFIGDLGAGKTEFIKGFLRSCGIHVRAASPSFVIMKRYGLRKKHYKNIYHFDLYRLHNKKTIARDLAACGWNSALTTGSITLVEWADRARRVIPKDAVTIRITHGRQENVRRIVITQP